MTNGGALFLSEKNYRNIVKIAIKEINQSDYEPLNSENDITLGIFIS